MQPPAGRDSDVGARRRGTADNGAGNATLYNPIRDAFTKRFPGIELQGVDQRGRETREKIIAEQQSHNYVADVAISGPDTQNELVQDGYIDDFQVSSIGSVIP